MARVIFDKGDDDASKMKLADTLLCLCDVSLETGKSLHMGYDASLTHFLRHLEKFNEALPDFKKAIEIKRSLLRSDDRQLAEAHYKYALALELSSEPAQLALDELQKAQTVLKERMATLSAGTQSDDKGKGKSTVGDASQKEINEIQELVAELDEKVSVCMNLRTISISDWPNHAIDHRIVH